MTVQTTYEKEGFQALPGLIRDISNTNIQSFAAEEVIDFGRFVNRGAATPEDTVVVSSADGDALGIAVRTAAENKYQAPAGLSTQYNETDTVGVLRSGFIWLEMVSPAGAIGDVVSVSTSGKGNAAAGTPPTSINVTLESAPIDIVIDGVTTTVAIVNVRG